MPGWRVSAPRVEAVGGDGLGALFGAWGLDGVRAAEHRES